MPKPSLRGARRRGNPGGIGSAIQTDIQNILTLISKKPKTPTSIPQPHTLDRFVPRDDATGYARRISNRTWIAVVALEKVVRLAMTAGSTYRITL
jgi:hypothetical protein